MKVNNENILIPLCAWCGRTRINDTWVNMKEHYVGRHEITALNMGTPTHGICPDCVDEFYPQYSTRIKTDISGQ